MDTIWIDSDEQLRDCAARWLESSAIGLDTEFEHRRTFYPRQALLQVYDGERVYLLDPLEIEAYDSLGEVLKASHLVKVFHSARQDLLVLWRMCSAIARPIFDVQIAAMLAGGRQQSSYQSLVLEHFDVSLPKAVTTSNWLRRPLSEEQMSYAADDVIYLLDLYDHYHNSLKRLGRLDWLREDCDYLSDTVEDLERSQKWRPLPRLLFLTRHSPEARAVLRGLGQWRETRARTRDRPRGWILQDKELLRIARRQPRTIGGLIDTCGLGEDRVKRYGAELLKVIYNARVLPEDERALNSVSPAEETALLDAVRGRESAMTLSHGALLNRTEVRSLLYAHKNGTRVEGRATCPWRTEIVAKLLELGKDEP